MPSGTTDKKTLTPFRVNLLSDLLQGRRTLPREFTAAERRQLGDMTRWGWLTDPCMAPASGYMITEDGEAALQKARVASEAGYAVMTGDSDTVADLRARVQRLEQQVSLCERALEDAKEFVEELIDPTNDAITLKVMVRPRARRLVDRIEKALTLTAAEDSKPRP